MIVVCWSHFQIQAIPERSDVTACLWLHSSSSSEVSVAVYSFCHAAAAAAAVMSQKCDVTHKPGQRYQRTELFCKIRYGRWRKLIIHDYCIGLAVSATGISEFLCVLLHVYVFVASLCTQGWSCCSCACCGMLCSCAASMCPVSGHATSWRGKQLTSGWVVEIICWVTGIYFWRERILNVIHSKVSFFGLQIF